MADRSIFIPKADEVGVKEVNVNFKWHSGFALVQKQKTIHELHEEARGLGFSNILEISSKSPDPLGVSLSAFNLLITTRKKNQSFSVESAFQGSKVFEKGGPYLDLFSVDSKTAKKDPRVKSSGNLEHFLFFNKKFPILPRTYFYDWLYINALMQHPRLVEQVMSFNGFSDIEFNPEKSINCQAHAVALFISLMNNGTSQEHLKSPKYFLECTSSHYENQKRAIQVQSKMF